MSKDHSPPPIASPYGSGELPAEPVVEIEAVMVVCLSFEGALRSACLGLFTNAKQFMLAGIGYGFTVSWIALLHIRATPITSLFSLIELWALYAVGYALFVVGVSTFWQLAFSRRFEVEIEQNGIHVNYLDPTFNYLDREFLLPWSDISWIINFDGNVQVISRMNNHWSCFIHRECFASIAQSQTFARDLRQIWQLHKRQDTLSE